MPPARVLISAPTPGTPQSGRSQSAWPARKRANSPRCAAVPTAAAVSAAVSSVLVAATGVVHDWYSANYPQAQFVMLREMQSSPAPTEPTLATAPATGTQQGLGYYGGARSALRQGPMRSFGAVVAEPVNGIVLESTRGLGATVDSQYGGGYEVNLGAVNTGAFGTPGFKV